MAAPAPQTERRIQVASGSRGMVSTGHPLATDAALEVLRAGGNAVDAAVCAAFVLSVVCPYACTLGGDLYALVYDPATKRVAGLNATGRSPRATADDVPAEALRVGVLSATIPALVRGLGDLLERYGSRGFGALLEPAIAYAAGGFAVHQTLADNTRERAELLGRDPAASALFLPEGKPLALGTTFKQPDAARVLRAIAAGGPAAFYTGEVAASLVADARAIGGTFALDDFSTHESLWQSPLGVPFYGHDVWTMPPNSFGPTLLFQLLELEAQHIDTVDPESAEFVARGFAARKRAYAQAAKWIADPAIAEAPMRALLAAALRERSAVNGAPPPEARDRCTTNAIVIDGNGLAVSLIESVSAPYGSGVVLEGSGILLNNRMAGFNTDRAHANGIAAGKRPANTLAPCMVTQSGALAMSIGTPGTVGQTCTLAQILARVYACGQDIAGAAAPPRWSVDFQGKLVVEDTMAPALRDAVLAETEGAHVMPSGWISFGSIKAAAVTPGGLTGIADYRRAATTAGC
jgi:gamma-glutamyltranspeptidase/glutathione hydrolase